MSDKLPEFIDPVLFAERRSILSGSLKIASLERLSSAVSENSGNILVELQFDKLGKYAVVSGQITTVLQLECQSCLQQLEWAIDAPIKLAVVSSIQEADQLEIDCEPLLFNGDKISLNELIEDEILLMLPDYPKHDYDCIVRRHSKDAEFDDSKQDRTHNPFSVLANLKKTGE